MTAFAINQNMASVCLTERIIPADITVLVVSVCVALLRVIRLSA